VPKEFTEKAATLKTRENPATHKHIASPVPLTVFALAAVLLATAAAGIVPVPARHLNAMLPWSLAPSATPPAATSWDSLWWDGVAQFYPWRWTLHDSLRKGEIPLWSPWSFCGYPFAANGQSSCFYPPALFACAVWTPGRAMSILWLFHLALAVFLTWGFARRMGISSVGGLAGGIAYAGGGFILAWSPVPSLVQSASWLPGALWAVEALLHQRPWSGAFALALCLAMSVLAGHMQIAGYVWLVTALWVAARLIGRAVRRKPWLLLPPLVALVLAAGLSAVQWLPTAELGRLSPRGGEIPTAQGYRFAQLLALKPKHLLTAVWPTLYGLPNDGTYTGVAFAEHFCGLGPLTLLLAVAGIVGKRTKHTVAMLALAALALSIGMATPVARLIYFCVPLLGLTAGFQRTLFVFCLAFAVLAGMGFDLVQCLLRGRGVLASSRSIICTALLLTLTGQAIWITARILPFAHARDLCTDTPATKWIREHCGPQARILALTPRTAWTVKPRPSALMPPNTSTALRLQDVQGYDSLYPRLFKEVAAKIEGCDPSPLANGNMVLIENAEAPQLGRLAVRYVISAWPMGSPVLQKVAEFGPPQSLSSGRPTMYVYQRKDWQPRWRITHGQQVRAVEVLAAGYNQVVIRVGPGSGLLELADTPYPGWKVYVDATRCELARNADSLVRAVPLAYAPRARLVTFTFWPVTIVFGQFMSLLALASITAGLAFHFHQSRVT
jgi:hypothetical protein